MVLNLVHISGKAFAENFNVGGKQLIIPSPQGYVPVTEKMGWLYRYNLQKVDPMNDQLAFYISTVDAQSITAGKTQRIERFFLLNVNKSYKELLIDSKEFGEIKAEVKKKNKNTQKSALSIMFDPIDKMNKGVSKEFNVDFKMEIPELNALDPHSETDRALAYSLYRNTSFMVESEKRTSKESLTVTFLNVSGKLFYLYCWGPHDDLEWTRTASKIWANRIIASNPPPPQHSEGISKIDWRKIGAKVIAAMFLTGIASIIVALSRMMRKKN
jgi:hypothetical protein